MAKRKSFPANRQVLTKEKIFGVPLRVESLYVPEWDGVVFIQELTAREIQINSEFVLDKKGNPDRSRISQIPVKICLQKVVDEEGNRLFSDQDIRKLEQMHGAAVRRISEAVRKLSGLMTEDDSENLAEWLEENYPQIVQEYREEQNPISQAQENFTTTPNGDSPSA